MGEVRIEWMTLDDLDALVNLHSVYLNYGDGIIPHFAKILADKETIPLKYVADDGAMGGLLIYTKGVALSGGHADLCAQIMEIVGDESIYTADAVLLQRKYRGGGISKFLYERAKKEMILRGVKYVLHELWVLPDGSIPARRLPWTFGETRDMGLFKNFYENFDHYGYYCPICKGKCTCSARLYLSKVE
jgi:GNAT superfamily N-acetyltransferase